MPKTWKVSVMKDEEGSGEGNICPLCSCRKCQCVQIS